MSKKLTAKNYSDRVKRTTFTEDMKQAGLVAVAAIGAFVVTVIVIVIVIALIKKK